MIRRAGSGAKTKRSRREKGKVKQDGGREGKELGDSKSTKGTIGMPEILFGRLHPSFLFQDDSLN